MSAKRVTVSLSEESIVRLRAIAEDWGLMNTAGPAKGQGNISGLMEALGQGTLQVAAGANGSSSSARKLSAIDRGILDEVRELVQDLVDRALKERGFDGTSAADQA